MSTSSFSSLPTSRIIRTWWPLAASWLFMATELPLVSAVIARLPHAEINLAAYGGIVFPVALIVESPIIMLLAASTALSKDWASYVKLRRFMTRASAVLTALHFLIAFTPLYYFVAEKLIGAPPEIIEPGRIGLMIMTPWTWSIAYRRFNQGVLIRFDESRAVGIGTAIRLMTVALMLTIGFAIGILPGIVVGTSAIAAGVVSEAIYAGWRVRPVLHGRLKHAPPLEPPLTFRAFTAFYIPLAMTSLFTLLIEPLGSAALSRMPQPIESLAVWPVISGFIFMTQSLGTAYNEVVVALMDQPRSFFSLRRFALALTLLLIAGVLIVALTPLAGWWFGRVSGLAPALAEMARRGLWLALPMSGLSVLQSWFQGTIMHGRKTRGITESVVVFMVACGGALWAGVALSRIPGLYVGLFAFTFGTALQTLWLWQRSQPTMQAMKERDTAPVRLAATPEPESV